MSTAASNVKYPDTHPDGIYRVKIIGQSLVQPEDESKLPFLKLKVEILSLKKKNDPKETNPSRFGSHRYIDLYFTEKAIERTKQFIYAAGFKATSVRALDSEHSDYQNGGCLVGFEFDSSNAKQISKSTNPKYAGKQQDRFSALPVGNPNSWMEKLNRPKTEKMMKLEMLFKAGQPQVTTEAIAKQPVQQPAQLGSNSDAW